MNNITGRIAISTLLVGAIAAAFGQSRVFTATNSAAGNSLVVLNRAGNGTVNTVANIPTGGFGLGAGLGNQGGLALDESYTWIAVVNAGDNSVSLFRSVPGTPQFVSRFPSGGAHPISVTWNRNRLFVLNDGDGITPPNIQGFVVSPNGTASPIAGGSAPLSFATADPAQIKFSPRGDVVVVTEKNTNLVDVFRLNNSGAVIGSTFVPAAGTTPFGFDFDERGRLFVSEAFGGAALGSATSSYGFDLQGNLSILSAAIPTQQTAACWLDVSPKGRWAYVGNAGSGSLSTYEIANDGTIQLRGSTSLGTGARALDTITSRNGLFVHAINSAAGSVVTFRVGFDGSLTKIDEDIVMPGINGLVAL